jgi:hypothetical protein
MIFSELFGFPEQLPQPFGYSEQFLGPRVARQI